MDLIVRSDHSSDMMSYNYLCSQALFALSTEMKNLLKSKHLDKDGSIALGLVTERLATVQDLDLFYKKAVLTRRTVNSGSVQAMNEKSLQDLYAIFTPAKQTESILKNNGILGTSNTQAWANTLISKAPSIDDIVQMKFSDLNKMLKDAPKREQTVVHQMYAGVLGEAQNAVVPPIRKHLLQNGIDLHVAAALESVRELSKKNRSFFAFFNIQTHQLNCFIASRLVD